MPASAMRRTSTGPTTTAPLDSLSTDESPRLVIATPTSLLSERASAPTIASPYVAPLRSTDTPLGSISFGRLLQLSSYCVQLRCPNCGKGPILSKSKVRLLDRCSQCNFRYMRSDDNYFDGAMFCSLMIMEAIFGVSLALSVILMWPNVPWDALTYVAVGGMVVLAIMMQPLGKVAWLFLDVMFRPILPQECECRALDA